MVFKSDQSEQFLVQESSTKNKHLTRGIQKSVR
jgi:hypothetical protein